MRILVTGGTGFIGKTLVHALAADNEVTVFSRNEDIGLPDSVRLVTGDITKKSNLRKAFSKPDIVFHLAANNDEDDPLLFATNVLGTENVAALCREKGVKQLIFASSAGVVGESASPVKEHSRYDPKTKFDKSKVGAERIVKDSGLAYTIVRFPLVLGPNLAWSKIFESIKNNHPIPGTGTNKFHIVHIDDAVRFLLHVFNNKRAAGHIFNMASKDIMTYAEFYATVCRHMRVRNKYKYRHPTIAHLLSRIHWYKTALKGRPTEPHMSKTFLINSTRNCCLSIQKAKELLGFEPMFTTPAAINITIKDLRSPRVMPY
jgi:dihydroflavonol-4-reductase